MGALDARTEQTVARFADQVQAVLGPQLVCLALYGSAAGDDWVPGRSDVNLAIRVVRVAVEPLKSCLIVLRHLLSRRDGAAEGGYRGVLRAGEAVVGPLPVMARLLDHRTGATRVAARVLRAEFAGYLEEVERIVAALDQLDQLDRLEG